MRLVCAVPVIFALVSGGAAAWAETIEVPDLVVTATRVPTSVENIAAGVTVIDRAAIEAHGYTNLTQALSDVPGLHVSPSGPQGGLRSTTTRKQQRLPPGQVTSASEMLFSSLIV